MRQPSSLASLALPLCMTRHPDERNGVEAAAEHEQLGDRPQWCTKDATTHFGVEVRRPTLERRKRCLLQALGIGRERPEHLRAHSIDDRGCADRQLRSLALDHRGNAGWPRAGEALGDGGEWLIAVGDRQRLKKNAQQAVAAHTEPPQLVRGVAQIVSDGRGSGARHHASGALRKIALEAAAADEPAIIAVRREQDAMPGLAVRRARSFVHGREHERLRGRTPRVERLQ